MEQLTVTLVKIRFREQEKGISIVRVTPGISIDQNLA